MSIATVLKINVVNYQIQFVIQDLVLVSVMNIENIYLKMENVKKLKVSIACSNFNGKIDFACHTKNYIENFKGNETITFLFMI